MRKWTLLTATTILFALVVLAYAQPQAVRQERGPAERAFQLDRLVANQALIEELDLNDDQVEALKRVHLEAKKATVELRARQELAQLNLRSELDAETPDAEKVMSSIEDAGRAQIEMRKQQVRVMLQAREILGPETLKELQERRQERATERMEQRRQRMAAAGDRPLRGRSAGMEPVRARNRRPLAGDAPPPARNRPRLPLESDAPVPQEGF